ncbi:acetyltransferase-like isoleucine patch superfamily enzyme [Mitsuaria sp. BK045]|nr:acetyltransferase-like isoleucine patch superfamily enzyme [Mitsuaria sp. BK045]
MILALGARVALAVSYRWRRLCSALVASRFGHAPGHVYLGKDCIVVGHRHIRLEGRLVALARNRIEAIDRHGSHRFTPRLQIGDNVSMEYDCHIGCVNEVSIGARVLMASRVYISDHAHGGTTAQDLALPPNARPVVSKGPVIIEDDVWLGEGVAVMPGVRIGRASVIGANAVVTRDIPPFSVAVGAPARVIKTLPAASDAPPSLALPGVPDTAPDIFKAVSES